MTASTLITDYIGVGLLAARPNPPNVGAGVSSIYFATDTSALYFWDGAVWTTIAVSGSTPPGGADHDVQFNNGGLFDGLTLTNGQLIIGSTGADPATAALTAGSNIAITNGAGSISIKATPAGGDHTIQYNNGGTTFGALTLTDGQLLIGSTGATPATAALTAGSNITITPAAGGITIAQTAYPTFDNLTDVTITSVTDEDIIVYDSGSSLWKNHQQRYDLGFSAPQTTAYSASQVVGHHRFSTACEIPNNFGAYLGRTSKAGGSAVTTASTVFSVEIAGTATPLTFSQVGTITFALGTITPTFATTSGAVGIAAGDVLRIVAPASPDATFVGFYCTIVAHET